MERQPNAHQTCCVATASVASVERLEIYGFHGERYTFMGKYTHFFAFFGVTQNISKWYVRYIM